MYQCHILNHLHLSQVILTVLQLGFTETFEHIGPLLTLYIVLLCVSRCADEGLGTQKSPTRLLCWNSLCSKVSKRLKLSYIATSPGSCWWLPLYCMNKRYNLFSETHTFTLSPYSDTKLSQEQQKTATEALLLRFLCGATGNRTRDTRIFSPLLYQLSYGTIFCLRTCPSFDWDCKGRHFFLTCKFFFNFLSKILFFVISSGRIGRFRN